MSGRRFGTPVVLALAIAMLGSTRASAQTPTTPPPAPASAPPAVEADTRAWTFSASAWAYFLADSSDYLQPTLTADYDRLHLEARYNYEGQDTGSIWLGYRFGGGSQVEWEVTPMLAGVFGNTTGVAPGYNASLSWRMLDVYSEGEYVIDTADSANNFFFNWSELAIVPVDWFRFGLATQRTRAYQSDRDIQRGLLVGFTYGPVDATGYVLNPDDSAPTVIVALRVNF